ncbi:MAG TPA: hypothetical protein VL084_09570 [Thermoanaerobaculia bacterium]|nr:hypothetical protein [Thermoanaerobaculia bacterium]
MRRTARGYVLRLPVLGAAILAAVAVAVPERAAAQAPAARPAVPFAVEYYYKAKWGFAEEFARLFRKNHLPVLKKQIESGRILEVKAEKPRYHATEDGRWDFRVTIVFVSAAAATDGSGEAEIARQLFPDQETFRREEQRRFEILLAHWDVPVTAAREMAP